MAGRAFLKHIPRIELGLGIGLLVAALSGCGGGGGGGPVLPVTVSVSPATASLAPGGTQDFTATVSQITNKAVTWSLQEGAAGGTITAAGKYTAPATIGTYHVLASSVAAPSKTAQAIVTVHTTVTITPAAITVPIGQATILSATVVGSANTAVTWSVQESAAGGTVDSAGKYTAPATPGTYHVIATSQADATQTAATITVVAGSATGTIR